MVNKKWFLVAAIVACLGFGVWYSAPWNQPVPPIDESLTTIRFGMLPYGDHTQAIIGVEKGWFKEVGIDLQHEVIKIENLVPFLSSGTLDVCSSPAGLLYPAYKAAPNLSVFVFADIFQGYAIVANPGLGCKSFSEFVGSGLTPDEAFKKTVSQLRGRTFAYPSEAAIKPFIDIVLQKGGVTREDFTSLVQDDALTINAMRNNSADFQVGGAPSRIVLQREGFKSIISSQDIAQYAKPSHLSQELGSVFPDGWATSRKRYENDLPTILRLASVCFRINDLIVNHPDEALRIHMPYLSKVTGESFTVESGKIIYNDLDPFYTFEQQNAWFHDEKNPYFYRHINGAGLQSFIDQGIYEDTPPDIETFILADDVYLKMEELKSESLNLIERIETENIANSIELQARLVTAKHHLEIYNYFDSHRIAEEIIRDAQ
ncbi:MAG: hypothetical protein SGI77_13925 [Pirellulaceae bacterium]|nr:hypothetical protein [Pirellulaceae bacterium]